MTPVLITAVSRITASFLMISATALASGALSGRLVDENGDSLPNATVKVHMIFGEPFDASSQTNSLGTYSFQELPDGEYVIEASLTGFVSVSYNPVRIYFPAQVEWDITLRVGEFGDDAIYAASDLVGELRWRGNRVPHAKICLIKSGGSVKPACTAANGLGQYFLEVPPAKYTVTVDSASGLHTKEILDLSTAGVYRDKILVGGYQ